MNAAAWLQAGSTVVLVLVTIVYVWWTRKLAKQAEATAQSAEQSAEAAQQTVIVAARPYLRVLQGKAPWKDNPRVDFRLDNIGNGPAINVNVWLVVSGERIASKSLDSIAPGERSPRKPDPGESGPHDHTRFLRDDAPADWPETTESHAWGLEIDHEDRFETPLTTVWQKTDHVT